MTALEQAKRFVQRNAATTALVIIPLAMASSAQATPIFFDPDADADMSHSDHITDVTDPTDKGVFSPFGTGGIRFADALYSFEVEAVGAGSGSGFSLTLTLSGSGSGFLDTPVPAHYDYTFSFSSNVTNFSSSIQFFTNGEPVGGGEHEASASEDLNLQGWETPDLSVWSVVLKATFATDEKAATVTLDIPPHSIDIMPGGVAAAEVPEPATMLLVGTGMGLFAVRRRRLRQSRQ